MSLTDALLGPAPGPGPLVTHYDDATGERVELSGVTTANWAAKAANLLRDECDVEPGTPVAVLLPAHWQTAAVLLAVWSCGAELVSDPSAAEWVLADADHLDAALAAEPGGGVVALSLDAFGKGLTGLPAGVVDFATEVRVHGDEFVPWDPVQGDAPLLGGRRRDPRGVPGRPRRGRVAGAGGEPGRAGAGPPRRDGALHPQAVAPGFPVDGSPARLLPSS